MFEYKQKSPYIIPAGCLSLHDLMHLVLILSVYARISNDSSLLDSQFVVRALHAQPICIVQFVEASVLQRLARSTELGLCYRRKCLYRRHLLAGIVLPCTARNDHRESNANDKMTRWEGGRY